jgi:hypothetical protein
MLCKRDWTKGLAVAVTLGCLGVAIVPSTLTVLTHSVSEQAQHRGSGRITHSHDVTATHRGSGRVDEDTEGTGWVAWRGSGRLSNDDPSIAQT